MTIEAVLFDFGGVLTTSPFDAFARYERDHGLPAGFIRGLNATNPDTNAWARLERSEIDFGEFCNLFEAEARDAGYGIAAPEIMALLSGELRPEMVDAVRRCSVRLKTALLTNNWIAYEHPAHAILEYFDAVVASSDVAVRKPEPRFYAIACERLEIEPSSAVFLDDLGINLKPAREMGMTTIKVGDPETALAELEAAVGFPVR